MDPLTKHDILTCFLYFWNMFQWGYLTWEFWDEGKRKHRGPFFKSIVCIMVMILMLCVGTIVSRGLNITDTYGLTSISEPGISYLSRTLQELVGCAMLVISGIMIYLIHKKRKEQ